MSSFYQSGLFAMPGEEKGIAILLMDDKGIFRGIIKS
jgi:hypothetical protein